MALMCIHAPTITTSPAARRKRGDVQFISRRNPRGYRRSRSRLASRLHKSDGTAIAYFDYARDAAGNIARIGRETDLVIYYSYDNGNRLASEVWRTKLLDTQIYGFSYGYDAANNRLAMRREAAAGVESESAYYAYAADNSMTKKQVFTPPLTTVDTYYYYDANGALIKAWTPDPAATTYFAYGPQQLPTIIAPPNEAATYFYYDSLLNRYCINKAGAVSYYLWDGLSLLEERNADGTLKARYTHGYTPIYGVGSVIEAQRIVGAATYYQYLCMDHRGTTHVVTDANQAAQIIYTLDAYGRELAAASGADPNVPNELIYQANWQTITIGGKRYCQSASRIFVPDEGQFTQRDPLPNLIKVVSAAEGNALGIYAQTIFVADVMQQSLLGNLLANGFGYAGANPTSNLDPTGFGFFDANGGGGWAWNFVKNSASELAQDVGALITPGPSNRRTQILAQQETLLAGVLSTLPIVNNATNWLRKDAIRRVKCIGGSTAGFDAVFGIGVGTGIAEQLILGYGAGGGTALSGFSNAGRITASRVTLGTGLVGVGENVARGNYGFALLGLLGTRGIANFIPAKGVPFGDPILQKNLGITYLGGEVYVAVSRFTKELARNPWAQPFFSVGHEAWHLLTLNRLTDWLRGFKPYLAADEAIAELLGTGRPIHSLLYGLGEAFKDPWRRWGASLPAAYEAGILGAGYLTYEFFGKPRPGGKENNGACKSAAEAR